MVKIGDYWGKKYDYITNSMRWLTVKNAGMNLRTDI